MKTKTLFGLFALVSLVILSLSFASAVTVTLATWNFDSGSQSGSAFSGVVAESLIVSNGISANFSSNTLNSSGWPSSTNYNSNEYFQIELRPSSGNELVVESISFSELSKSNPDMDNLVRYMLDGDEAEYTNQDLIVSEGEEIVFRFYAFNASSSDTWVVDNIQVIGTVNSVDEIEFCKEGIVGGDLEITDVEIDGSGDDEEWNLLDEVEIKVDVENNGNEDLEDIVVEMGLYRGGKNYAKDLDFSSKDEEEQELGDIDEGDDDTATFTFKVPADFEDGNYRLVVKAFPDGDEDIECAQEVYETTIDVQREDDEDKFVIVDDFTFPTEAFCGEEVSGSFTLYNIGDEDQDQVLIRIFSNELDVEEEIITREDLNEGDDQRFDFSFTIPNNLKDNYYNLNFATQYGYDDDDNTYDDASEDTFSHRMKVSGCDGTSGNGNTENMIGSVELDSDAMAGEPLVVRATITNTGSSTANFVLSASGYQSWASLDSISDRIVNLAPGASRTVTITLNVNEDVSGRQSFVIESNSNGNLETKNVDVVIDSGSNGLSLGGNSLIWIIGIINVILIILIIVVAIRLAR